MPLPEQVGVDEADGCWSTLPLATTGRIWRINFAMDTRPTSCHHKTVTENAALRLFGARRAIIAAALRGLLHLSVSRYFEGAEDQRFRQGVD